MKKILALLLAMVMVLALAACGGGSAEEPAAAPVEEPAAEAVVPDAAAPVKPEVPAEPEAPAAEAGDASGEMGVASGEMGDASGEASGAPSGDPPEGTHPDAELVEPTADYSKDLDGYKAYAIDALKTDPGAPAASKDEMIANIEAAESADDDAFGKLTEPGRILVYEDFLAF